MLTLLFANPIWVHPVPAVEIEELSAFYGKAQALDRVSLTVAKGETVAVIGANGAGKSTLLDSIMGLTSVKGKVRLDGEDVTGLKPSMLVGRGLGYAPERFNLFPHMSVRDNLLVGAHAVPNDIGRNLEMVYGLFPRLHEREAQETSTQSGGERQMVALGRALMTSPRVLLVDEPTIGLAPKICLEIARVLRHLSESMGLTVIVAEQNANFALSLAQRLYILEVGKVTAEGTAAELASDEMLARSYFGNGG